MIDSEILVGDVCIDLVERGKVQVVARAADTVESHRAFNSYDVADYKANALLGIDEDEPVFECVYLPENPTTSYNQTYDMPRSRLARCPVEDANDGLARIQDDWTIQILADLFQTAEHGDDIDVAEIAREAIGKSVVEEARELADARDAAEVNVNVE